MNPLIPFVWTAGVVHLLIVASNFWIPSLLHYGENLAKVSPIVRNIFVVHSIYMALVLLGFSALCLFFAPELTGGSPLGRSLSGFLAVFWLLRVVLQFAYYDRELRARYRRGDVAYTFAVASLGTVFTIVALGVVK